MPSVELLKQKAYLMYLVSDEWESIATAVGKSVETVRRWSVHENWADKRDAFLGKVQTQIDKKLEDATEEIAKVSIDFARILLDNIKERFSKEIVTIEMGTFKDMMSGIKDAITSITELLQLVPPEKKVEESATKSLTVEEKMRMLEKVRTISVQIDKGEQLVIEEPGMKIESIED